MDKNKIIINPVTRIEGHAKITLRLDEGGKPVEARFHVAEFRGFEKFCEGRHFTEMPTITPRICGICPVSHAVASARACEDIMAVRIPPAAHLLRKLMHLGQVISSHALSFFHLSSPDILLGWDSDPAKRNIFGVAEKFPEVAKRGIRLRKFGQEISERITGKKIHSDGIAAGGMTAGLEKDQRDALLAWYPEVLDTARLGFDIFKNYAEKNREDVESFAAFPSLYMGTVGPGNAHELYDGRLRFVDAAGKTVSEDLDPRNYLDFIAEKPVSWSYLKYPYYKPLGEPAGYYRVGPLARLNVAEKMTTPLARAEFRIFKSDGPRGGSFYFHQARLIEILTALEQIRDLLNDPRVLAKDLRAEAGRNQEEGIGCTEAPRGTLFHHYATDEGGKLKRVNLLIATGQNNPAMNFAVLDVAKKYVDGKNIKEGALNRVEAAIRCYDPCLSCSTHALGNMPLTLEVFDAEGNVVASLKR